MKKLLALFVCLGIKGYATDYTFINLDYARAVQQKHPWHFSGDARWVAPASFKTHSAKGSDFHYGDTHGSLYYSHFIHPHHALSWEVGYSFMHLGWAKNPRFSQSNFQNALASVAWVTDAMEKWRWIMQLGASVNAATFEFANSGVYSALVWGRYCYSKHIGLHVGMGGFTGIKQTYTLPIIGFDATFSKWVLHAIFPLDFSLKYSFSKHFSTSLVYDTFGGPYRFPRRVDDAHGKYHHAIVEVHSSGVSWNLGYEANKTIWASVGAGWNFGGWMLIRNGRGHHGKYYKFESAPYALAELALSF